MINSFQCPTRSAMAGKNRNRFIRTALALLFVMAIYAVAHGQYPPPVGPDSYKVDKTDIWIGLLTGMVKTQIDQIVADTNSALAARGTGLRVRLIDTPTYSPPFRLPSENINRPNQYYVKLPMNFGINISIPHLSDRQVYYPLDLNVTCNGWYTGSGVITVEARTGPPSVEGGNFIEDLVFARDYIDSEVKSHLPRISAIVQTIPNTHCVTIGPSPSNGTPDKNAFIAFDAPPRLPIGNINAAFPRLTVTFQRLKRLAARGNGQLLYTRVENFVLDVYANFVERQSATLTMKEGDDIALNIPPVVFTAPIPDILVIIGNIQQQQTNSDTDTTFVPAMRAANFTPGQRTLDIPKTYIIPGGVGHPKPSFAKTAAYELTYTVAYATAATVQGNTH